MTIGGTRWPGPTFRDQFTPAEEAGMEAGQAESEDRDALMDDLQEAVSRVSCGYYRGRGICEQGCHSEPACQTDEPTEGWFAHIAAVASELALSEEGK